MRGSLLLGPLLGFALTASAFTIENRATFVDDSVFKKNSFTPLSPEQATAQLEAAERANSSAVTRPETIKAPANPGFIKPPQPRLPLAGDSGSSSDVSRLSTPSAPNAKIAAAGPPGSCATPKIRYEWNRLTTAHREQFTAAALCLFRRPTSGRFPGARTRWEDMVVVHQLMAETIHNVGQFLPWHRYYLWIFEGLLRDECGYTGPMTWWDETRNAGNFNGAAPFTQKYFGHMPVGRAVCIISGQFRGAQCNIGPGSSNVRHCLSRGVNEDLSRQVTTNFVNTCNSYNDYKQMLDCSFFGPHAYGHNAVGGVMLDALASPSDPAFFLHHAFIDHNWRIWQRKNPSARTYAIGGTTRQGGSTPTTLNYVLDSRGLAPAVRVQDMMDTQGGFLCYRYDY